MNSFSNEQPNPYERKPTSFTGIGDYRIYFEETHPDEDFPEGGVQAWDSSEAYRVPKSREEIERIVGITCLKRLGKQCLKMALSRLPRSEQARHAK